jgi:hypothetical protein
MKGLDMDEQWERTSADQVRPGDRVRIRGTEVVVARIEESFLNRPDMIAFIEDTTERWLKVPTPPAAEVEVLRAS